jgi:hypothetical protein
VHIVVGGHTAVVTQRVWVYQYVRLHGKRRKVIRQISAPVYAACFPPPCALLHMVKGKAVPVRVGAYVWVRVPRRGRLVWAHRHVRHYVIAACPTSSQQPPPLGTPITMTVNPSSSATLNFYAFQRQAPLSGTVQGYIVGGLRPGKESQIILTSVNMTVGQTPIFIDNVCNGQVSASIETGNPTTVTLDQTQQSTATLAPSGAISSVVNTIIRLPLALRPGDSGCGQTYLSTGYDQESVTFFFSGQLSGLTNVELKAAPQNVLFWACLQQGDPTEPCAGGFEIPVDVLVSADLSVNIALGH